MKRHAALVGRVAPLVAGLLTPRRCVATKSRASRGEAASTSAVAFQTKPALVGVVANDAAAVHPSTQRSSVADGRATSFDVGGSLSTHQQRLHHRSQATPLAERELGFNALERVSPGNPRRAALGRCHAGDCHVRAFVQQTKMRDDDVTVADDGRAYVVFRGYTEPERRIIETHLEYLAGERADPYVSGAVQGAANLPQVPGDEEEESLVAVISGATDVQRSLRLLSTNAQALLLRSHHRASTALNTSTTIVPHQEQAGVEKGIGFALYAEGLNATRFQATLAKIWGVDAGRIRLEMVSSSDATTVTFGFVQGVHPGNVLLANVAQLPMGSLRVFNLVQTTAECYQREVGRRVHAETNVLLRRCTATPRQLEHAVGALSDVGALNFYVGNEPRFVETMSLIAVRQFKTAMLRFLAVANPPKLVTEFLKYPQRTRAVKLVREEKEMGSRGRGEEDDVLDDDGRGGGSIGSDVLLRVVRVYAATGSPLAALTAIPRPVRRAMRGAANAAAFNALVSRRFRHHGRKVVIGDLVRDQSFGADEEETAPLDNDEDRGRNHALIAPTLSRGVRRVSTVTEAAESDITDVCLPFVQASNAVPEHFPECPGLTFAESVTYLETLGLDWVLRGSAGTHPTLWGAFGPLGKDGVVEDVALHADAQSPVTFRPVLLRPRMSFRVLCHPAPVGATQHDAACCLVDDVRTLAAGDDLRRPWKADANRETEEGVDEEVVVVPQPEQSLRDACKSSLWSVDTTSPQPLFRGEDRRQPTSLVTEEGEVSIEDGNAQEGTVQHARQFLVFPVGSVDPAFATPSDSRSEDLQSVRTVHIRALDREQRLWHALREAFVFRGVVGPSDRALQSAIHTRLREVGDSRNAEVDAPKPAARGCAVCFRPGHRGKDCPERPYRRAHDRDVQDEHRRALRQAAFRRGIVMRLERRTEADRWGIRLLASGEIDCLVKGSPAYTAFSQASLESATVLDPLMLQRSDGSDLVPRLATVQPANQPEGTAVLQRPFKVVGVNSVVVADGSEFAAAVGAEAKGALTIDIRVFPIHGAASEPKYRLLAKKAGEVWAAKQRPADVVVSQSPIVKLLTTFVDEAIAPPKVKRQHATEPPEFGGGDSVVLDDYRSSQRPKALPVGGSDSRLVAGRGRGTGVPRSMSSPSRRQ